MERSFPYPGRFIVIDGVGGTGKSVQVECVKSELEAQGYECVVTSFPRYDQQPYGPKIKEYQAGAYGDPSTLSPYLASNLYSLDRVLARDELVGHLEAGKIVISARYISSNLAYQSAKLPNEVQQAQYRDWLEHSEYTVLKVVPADLVLFQYLAQETSDALMKKREDQGGEGADGHEKNAQYLAEVIQTYRNLATLYPDWEAIDVSGEGGKGILSREEITEKLMSLIAPILPRGNVI